VPAQVGRGASIGGGLAGVRESRLRSQRERLARLKESMQEAANKLRSEEPRSTAQRSALVARLNDLKRKINALDGIVAGEGQEARALGQAAGAPLAPAREGAPRAAGELAAANDQAAAAQGAAEEGRVNVVA